MTPTPQAARDQFAAWRRAASDWWTTDPHFRSLIAVHDLGDADALRAFAETNATRIDPLVRENNRDEHLPQLRRYDGFGRRTEEIVHHPSYREVGRMAYASGVMTLYGQPGQERRAIAWLYLFAQNGEAGHACPMACTAGLIKALRRAGNPRPAWLERLVDPDYDTHYIGAQFLTEIQGGSDVGANAVVARDAGDGTARLTGEKWFCSVIDADLFLVTARPEGAGSGTGGLTGYVVPRRLEDGSVNGFRVRRLKYKLGTRSMASAEVDFDGAWALPIADFRTVLAEVIDTSRVLNAVCCSAILQRAWREATTYAANRTAFGQPLAAFPSIARLLADLRTKATAARTVSFALASLGDRIALGAATDRERAAHRMLVNLNKFWTSLACTAGVRSAIEVLGGNGAIEEFSVLPRLLRDAIVLEAWEGGHGVLCNQVLRDCQRLSLHEATFDWLADQGAPAALLERTRDRWARHLGVEAPEAQAWIRPLCAELAPLVQAVCLAAEQAAGGTDERADLVIAALLAEASRPPVDDPDAFARDRALAAG